eukprot:TRINITY_DN34819_c0_g1_i5.p2 TRINITY_DN34819_c0_g1~~TRINITY_DN34819_c0_g1_i5.p2  ORF type:complete len:306 (+),score=54.55 TRINITY_DN34819_c0_g1_i5:75-992(+)
MELSPPEEELRIDCRDRGLWRKFTKAQFTTTYGGEYAWSTAPRLTDQRTSADHKLTGTVEQFIARFGNLWAAEWFKATPQSDPQAANCQESAGDLEHAGTPTGARTMREMVAQGALFLSPASKASVGVQSSPPAAHSVHQQTSPPAAAGKQQGVASPPTAVKPAPKAAAATRAPRVEDVEVVVRDFVHRRFSMDGDAICRVLAKAGWLRLEEMAVMRVKKPLLNVFRAEGVQDGRATLVVGLLRKLTPTRCARSSCGRQMAVGHDEQGLQFFCSDACSEAERQRQRPPVPSAKRRRAAAPAPWRP